MMPRLTTTPTHLRRLLLCAGLVIAAGADHAIAGAHDALALAIAKRSYGAADARRIADRSTIELLSPTPVPRPETVRPASRPTTRLALDAVRLERTERYGALIEHHSRLNHVEAELVKAIVYTESGGDARAESSQGAQGLMQLMPTTAQQYGARDPQNPEQSIASGARYLRDLLDRFGSDELALWAYNAGPGSVQRGHLPAETERYVPRVLAVRHQLRSMATPGQE